MAKLPTNVQKVAAAAEPSTGGGGPVLPEAIYVARCVKCQLDIPTRDGQGRKASWTLETDQEGVPRKTLFQDVSHDPKAAGLMHGAFNAFGLTLDSGEDEFVGERCRVDVGLRPSQNNPQVMQNYVRGLLALNGPTTAGNGQAPATTGTAAAPTADPWAQ
jgi:hypothetical protein